MYNYFLFLDDVRIPEDVYNYTFNSVYLKNKWVEVVNYDEFVKCIEENGVPHTVSFDHDIGFEHYEEQKEYDQYTEKTGYHCARWLIEHCVDYNLPIPSTILIHSANPVGRDNIKSLFDTYYKYFNDDNK